MSAHHGTVIQRSSLDQRPVDQTAREMSVLLMIRSSAMRPSASVSAVIKAGDAHAQIVGTAPHEMRLLKAVALASTMQSRTKATPPMKVVALRGTPSGPTLPIHDEPGRTPSRAMAKTSRLAATMQTTMF